MNRITDPEKPFITEPGMIPCGEVERCIGISRGSLATFADQYRVNVTVDWSGQHVITVPEAARLVREARAHREAERERKAKVNQRHAAEAAEAEKRELEKRQRTFDNEMQRYENPFFANAAVAILHDGAKRDRA